MEWLRGFFETNFIVVHFAYGLVFFLLGFAVSLQSRRPSTLTLARPLPLLALFGILHGIADWGRVFVPFQETYLQSEVVLTLQVVRIILTALAFTSLLAFALRLVESAGRCRAWLLWVPQLAFATWLTSFLLYPFLTTNQSNLWWIETSEAWTRYLLGSGAALLSIYALKLQFDEFRSQAMGHLIRYLRWAMLAFALYVLVGCLIVPKAPFFPANVLHTTWFLEWTGIPIEILRAISGLIMAVSIIRVLEIFDIEHARQLDESHEVRVVLSERDRIARELHDGVIQSLYGVGLGLENVTFLLDEDPSKARQDLAALLPKVNGVIREIREYIMDLKVPGEAGRSLRQKLATVIDDLRASYPALRVELDVFVSDPPGMQPETANELCQIMREAITNAVRHGGANRIVVKTLAGNSFLQIRIQDNGKGFDPATVKGCGDAGGHGLRNMRQRATLLGGTLEISGTPGIGAVVTAVVPLETTWEAT